MTRFSLQLLVLCVLVAATLQKPEPAAIPRRGTSEKRSLESRVPTAPLGVQDELPQAVSHAAKGDEDTVTVDDGHGASILAAFVANSTVDSADNQLLQCFCKPASSVIKEKRKEEIKTRILHRLQGFCNTLLYVNGRPTLAAGHEHTLLPYSKPRFAAVATTRNSGVIIQRDGLAISLPDGLLYKYGFQTADLVTITNYNDKVHVYVQGRFNQTPSKDMCEIRSAAISLYYGSTRIGGRIFKEGKLPFNHWISVTSSVSRHQLSEIPQRLTVQASHNFNNANTCHDTISFEVRRLLVCGASLLSSLSDDEQSYGGEEPEYSVDTDPSQEYGSVYY